LIEPLEPKTRVVTCAVVPVGVGYTGFGFFEAPDDVTLRRVVFMTSYQGIMDMVLSTDQTFEAVPFNENHEELQLYSGSIEKNQPAMVYDLVFPQLKGSRLFYGIGPNAMGSQLILLFFT